MTGTIHERNIGTMVLDGQTCASACFNMLLGGKPKRLVTLLAKIGVHSVADANAHEDNNTKAGTLHFARAYAEAGVPAAVIGKMVATPPGQIYGLTVDDKKAMFATIDESTSGKPAPQASATPYVPQAAPAPAAAPTAPTPAPTPTVANPRSYRITITDLRDNFLIYDFADGWMNGVFNETGYSKNGKRFKSTTGRLDAGRNADLALARRSV